MTAYVDFRFASTGDIASLGGPASRFNHNITAIKLLKSLEAEDRAYGDLAPDEQRKLVIPAGATAKFSTGFFLMALIRKRLSIRSLMGS